MSKSLERRINEIEQSFNNDKKAEAVTDIDFIIPGHPVQKFGQTFESMQACLAYCDKNNIPYKVEDAGFPTGAKSYTFG